jgi:nitrate reductase NapAB chaperone NapD
VQLSKIAAEESPTVLTILETLQTVLGLIGDAHPAALEYVLTEMEEFARQEVEGCAAQYELVVAVKDSDHQQASW